MPPPYPLDIIGDVHGELPALEALGRELGYRVADGWSHPDGRTPVFLGDLVDRGAHSLEVAELVRGLVTRRRAFCIMGNHEYNLVAWHAKVTGYERPKQSNRPTTEDILRRPHRWATVLEFFRDLPVGLELPDLRIVHACWHVPSLAAVQQQLRRPLRDPSTATDAVGWLDAHAVLRSPFDASAPASRTRLLPGLPPARTDKDKKLDPPHEILLKGFEVPAPEPFQDNDGKWRRHIRALWWRNLRNGDVVHDRPQVFGHYWNLPPVDGNLAPPHASGHPELRAWARDLVGRVPPSGRAPMTGEAACVDFHGVTKASELACIGALRWPEREIVWASAERTSAGGDED